MRIINSKQMREKRIKSLQDIVKEMKKKPTLVIVQVEGDKASDSYVSNKVKLGNKIGLNVEHILLPNNVEQKEVENCVETLNKRNDVNGIIVQLPLPYHINEHEVLNKIDYRKDVDGLTEIQMGKLAAKNPEALIPCTAFGVLEMLEELLDLEGKNVVIVNRSNLIGIPLQAILTQRNATVTLCHSKTRNLKEKMRNADIVITGIGKAKFFDASYFTDLQTIIDCSMNFKDGKICGDVDVDDLEHLDVDIASGTGHTGPFTVLSLIYNTVRSAMQH